MFLTQIVAPTNEPLSLEDAKTFMHIIETDEDSLITSMIVSAREYVENFTNRQLERATFELYMGCFMQDFSMPKNPIYSIEKVEIMGDDGLYTGMTEFYLYGENDVFKIHFDTFPHHKIHKKAIKITFVAGYETVPSSIVSCLKILVCNFYEHREQYIVGSNSNLVNEVPIVNKSLGFYRVQPL